METPTIFAALTAKLGLAHQRRVPRCFPILRAAEERQQETP